MSESVTLVIGVTFKMKVLKMMMLAFLEYNRARTDKGPNQAYEYIMEYGMRDIRKKLERLVDYDELDNFIHDITDESLSDWLSNEVEAIATDRRGLF